MGNNGIVRVVSKQAGTIVGKSVLLSKRFADIGFKHATCARDLLGRCIDKVSPATNKRSMSASAQSAYELCTNEGSIQKGAIKALVQALESDVTIAKQQLAAVKGETEKAHTKLETQLRALLAEKQSLVSDLCTTRQEVQKLKARKSEIGAHAATLESDLSMVQRELKQAAAVEQKLASSTEPAEQVQKIKAKVKNSRSFLAATAKMVTQEQVEAANFAKPSHSIMFARALSDITSQDTMVRLDAVRTIAEIAHELSVKALAAQVATDPNPQVRQECVKGLSTLQMPEGLSAVENALTDEAASVRLGGVWALYRMAGADSAVALVRMLRDQDEGIRRRATTCLGWMKREDLSMELLPLLSDSSASVRRAAVEAMSNLNSRPAVSALIERLNDPDKSVRRAILRALEKITGKKMRGAFPRDEKSLRRLLVRWQEWWKEELLG